ncbi:MAG: GNAT family N-acetyltransferase [Candidatus Diapherotrites archaeon]|nr:GNAT family N-acetyltransferase [Candidatus Diapherotrites archaeon]
MSVTLMDILPAYDSDSKEIVKMIKREFAYSKITEKKFLEKLESKSKRVFKAVEDKKIIGFVELRKLDFQTARISGFTIAPKFRGKGFGKKMLEFAIDFLRKKKIKRVTLLVRQDNEKAKKLYTKMGFGFMGLWKNKIGGHVAEEWELNLHSNGEETPNYVQ